MFTVRHDTPQTPKDFSPTHFTRTILKALRAMIDGPYKDWKPTANDWYRLKFGAVIYVDKDGIPSSMKGLDRAAQSKFRANAAYDQDDSSLASEPGRETHPIGSDDPEALRQMFGIGEPGGYRSPGDISQGGSFVDSPTYSDSSTTSSSLGFVELDGTNNRSGINGIGGGVNGSAHIAGGDSSSMLPMELMIYNDLMTDIEGTARFLGQDSILFGPESPASSLAPAGLLPGQEPWLQSPSTMYGWVIQPPSFVAGVIDYCGRFWERTLYDNFLNQISKQAT